MNTFGYFDKTGQQPLDLQDGCPLDDWLDGKGGGRFAIHPRGFPIFLPPEELRLKDEYRDGDPYGVAGEYSGFQQRRFNCTIELVRHCADRMHTGLRVLDLGCGEGHISAAVQRAVPSAAVAGLDYSITAIETAERLYPTIQFCVADAYEPPYSAGSFDLVICNNLWEHVPDPLRLLGAARGVLDEGGYILISTPSRYRLSNLLRVVSGRMVRFMSPAHVTEYSVGQLIEQLRFGGFAPVAILSRAPGSFKPGLKRLVKRVLTRRLLGGPIGFAIRLTGSHHSLETTVFVLAKANEAAEPRTRGT